MKSVLELLRLLTVRFPPPGGHHAFTYEGNGPEGKPLLVLHIMMEDRGWQIFHLHEEDFDKKPEEIEREICELLASNPQPKE